MGPGVTIHTSLSAEKYNMAPRGGQIIFLETPFSKFLKTLGPAPPPAPEPTEPSINQSPLNI